MSNTFNRRSLIKLAGIGAVGATGAGLALPWSPSPTRAGPYKSRKATTDMQPQTAPMELLHFYPQLTPGTHNAFPCLAMEQGTLRLVWRQGSDHADSRDGVIMSAVSYSYGKDWQYPSMIRSSSERDLRDPCTSYIDGNYYLSWFEGSRRNSMIGAVAVRNWSPAVSYVNVYGGGAMTAPIVKLPGNDLGAAWYDQDGSAWFSWSSNNGVTWSMTQAVDATAIQVPAPEPYLVVDGNTTHMFFRWDYATSIGYCASDDNGSSWSAPTAVLGNASGRPTTILTSSGRFVMIYREVSSKNAVMVHSADPSRSWSKPVTLLEAPVGAQPVGMTYASMVEIAPNQIYCVVGMEQADGSSQLWGTTFSVPA